MSTATDWYQRQSQIAANTSSSIEGLWGEIDPDYISESWEPLIPLATRQFTAGQLAAATQATDYVSQTVREQGVRPAPSGRVNPGAYAGLTADMLPIQSLLSLPAIQAKTLIGRGMRPSDALRSGLGSLMRYTGTEVADAGRNAVQNAMTAESKVTGYTRVVNLPACSRCIILAGQTYRWNAGFARHPHCDCVHRPYTSVEDAIAQGGSALFGQMSEAEQNRAFGKVEAQSIRDGADMVQVVNARRGMGFAGQMTTTEGTTRRGYYGRKARAADPQAEETTTRSRTRNVTRVTGRSERKSVRYCYWAANGDRDEALRLLRKYGYLT